MRPAWKRSIARAFCWTSSRASQKQSPNLILNEDVIKTERNVILEERRWRRETNPQVCWTRRSTRHCGRISPTAFRSNGWMQEMEKLNGTEAFTIYNKY